MPGLSQTARQIGGRPGPQLNYSPTHLRAGATLVVFNVCTGGR
jgi:hypothetical protein